MCLRFCLHGRCILCGSVFGLRVEGGERERFLQVLLASQTKLRGRGSSLRGEKADVHNILDQHHKSLAKKNKKKIEKKTRKSFYLWLDVRCLCGCGSYALPVRVRLGLLLVYLVDGGCDIRGGKGGLFFLPFLFAPSVHAVDPLA